MATWASLTTEQKDTYLTFENDLRALSGEFQRLLNKADALNARYTGQIAAILVALDDNTTVPKTTGLAGAQSLDSDADMAALRGDFDAILTTYNTTAKKEKRAKAAGQANI